MYNMIIVWCRVRLQAIRDSHYPNYPESKMLLNIKAKYLPVV